MSKKGKVVLIQRIFSSYRKPVYDLIFERYNFLVLHSYNDSGIHTTSTNYSKGIKSWKYGKGETHTYLRCMQQLIKFNPSIVIHEFAIGILSMPIVFLWCKLLRKKFVLWSHGYDRKRGFEPGKSLGDKYRLWFLRKADAVILYGHKDKELLSKFINPFKIFVANNTLDTDTLFALRRKMEEEGRMRVKERMGFITKYNLIFIGRLLKDKKPDFLIEIIELLSPDIVSQITIHFVGNGSMKEKLSFEIEQKGYTNLFKFHGEVSDSFLAGSLLYASDIMIMPGDVGLSVNHALFFLCPVLTSESTSSGPYHGPEEAYVINNITGFRENQNAQSFAQRISDYLVDQDAQNNMRLTIREYVERELTISRMVEGITDCLEYVNSKSDE